MKSQLRQYFKLITPYWKTKESVLSWIILVTVLAMSSTAVYVSIYLNRLTGDFYNCIEAKDSAKIAANLIQTSRAIIFYMIFFALKYYLNDLLDFRWRRWLTRSIMGRWFDKRAYYDQKQTIDNPDQRISEDIGAFTSGIISIFFLLFHEIIALCSFFMVLWNFSQPLVFSLFNRSYEIPHYLALFCFGYALLLNVLMMWMGRPLVSLNFQREKSEADFRYSLFRVREYSEEIALSRGEGYEKEWLDGKFSLLQRAFYRYLKRRLYIHLTNYAHMSIVSILPTLLSLPLLLSGDLAFGDLMRISGAFSHVLSALCIIASAFQLFASVQATKKRLSDFTGYIEALDKPQMREQGESAIICRDLRLEKPNGNVLFSDVNLEVKAGEKVLIMGRSGLGKTSLLRVLSGLWSHKEGRVAVDRERAWFVSQKPYFPISTLKECLAYPHKSNPNRLFEMEEILTVVSLAHLIPSLTEERDWMKSLSLGEQQRLNFARIFYHKPKLLLLDEPTSSLDSANEEKMMALLKERLPEMTLLTISHCESLKRHHDRTIVLAGDRERLEELISQTPLIGNYSFT